jgi:hypothetical protein
MQPRLLRHPASATQLETRQKTQSQQMELMRTAASQGMELSSVTILAPPGDEARQQVAPVLKITNKS